MPSTVKPFYATYYNPELFRDYSFLVCPPYDVISKDALIRLRKKSIYNFSHVLLADNNNYKAIGNKLNEWLKKRVLIDGEEQSFYLYEQLFNLEGKLLRRFGILTLLKMDKKGIFPHEYTLRAPKEDRKKIIKAARANLSPIFVIATKPLKALRELYAFYTKKQPFLKFKDDGGIANRVWKISDPEKIKYIIKEIDKSKLVIADGHHRFEISYDYFKKNKNNFKDLNYILAYVTDCQEGLAILPTHRIIKLMEDKESFFKKVSEYFRIKEISQDSLEEKLKKSACFCLGLYYKRKFFFLELKDRDLLDKISDKAYRNLDTYVFHQLFLPLFKTSGAIEYTHNIDEAKKIAGLKKVAFLLRATSLDSVITISSQGLRLPQKSTYFYPKLLSGIVLRRFRKHG